MIYDRLLVDVADEAKPAGWGDDPFTEDIPKSSTVVDLCAEVSRRIPNGHSGVSVQVGGMGGWWWWIEDVTPVGITS